MSPCTISTSIPWSGAGSAVSRIIARTGSPRWTSRRQMLLPTWPLAPVTRVGRIGHLLRADFGSHRRGGPRRASVFLSGSSGASKQARVSTCPCAGTAHTAPAPRAAAALPRAAPAPRGRTRAGCSSPRSAAAADRGEQRGEQRVVEPAARRVDDHDVGARRGRGVIAGGPGSTVARALLARRAGRRCPMARPSSDAGARPRCSTSSRHAGQEAEADGAAAGMELERRARRPAPSRRACAPGARTSGRFACPNAPGGKNTLRAAHGSHTASGPLPAMPSADRGWCWCAPGCRSTRGCAGARPGGRASASASGGERRAASRRSRPARPAPSALARSTTTCT